jgi:tetratricopeptide (TPR) repeat protein
MLRAFGHTLLPTWLPALLAMLMAAALLTPAAAVDVPNRNPPAEERAVRQAREAIGEQAWPRAVELLQTHIRAYPDDADAHNLLGYSLRQLGRFEPAQAAYERALAINPEHLGAHEYLGQLMITLGRRDRALHHLSTIERLCQASCEGYQQLKRSLDSAAPASPRGYGR